ncbi:MAG: LysR family transcriptional regulator [Rhizobiaceae bacterium]
MDIDLRLLRSFVTIHEQGSLARASVRLNCTPAALSMRLKMLETEVGAPLFARHPGGVVPTARGAELYARALAVLAVYDEMISTTRSQPARERVLLGLPDDYAAAWLPLLLRSMATEIEALDIEIVCDLSANLAAKAQRGEIDLAVVTLAARSSMLRHEVPIALNWIGSGSATVALAAYPEGCLFRREMIHALEAENRPWRIAVQSSSRSGILGAVRAGLCVTAVAAGTAPHDLDEVASTRFLPTLPRIMLQVIGPTQPRAALSRVEDRLVAVMERTPDRALA